MTAPGEGLPDAGLQAWLERTGPHALLRSTRGGDPLLVSLAVRPGALTNTVTAITVRFVSEAGSVEVEIPVFALYRRQWTLDLTAAVPADALAAAPAWRAEVVLASPGADDLVLPVQQALRDAFSLQARPELTGQPWTLVREPAVAGG